MMATIRVKMVPALLLLLHVTGCSFSKPGVGAAQQTTATYHAVLLDTGQVYFGKLQGFGTPYPILTDVYYVHGESNSEPKQAKNLLVKRGNEWHKPDHMQINANHIVVVEPVAADSRVAQLIHELQLADK